MGSKKPEPVTRDSVVAASDAQLNSTAAAYSAATVKLYNLLLRDNDGDPIAALGALSIFRTRFEQSILDQIRARARAAQRRKDGRGRGRPQGEA